MKNRSGVIQAYLNKYAHQNNARFHMPGHKGKSIFDEDFCAIDITEISGADNLLKPNGIIKIAQEQAANFFGSKNTFFSTCGASAAISAAIMAIPQDYTVIASRDCHKSVVSALALSGHEAFLIDLEYDKRLELNKVIDVDNIAKAIGEAIKYNENKHNKLAIIITRPDYFGRCCDISSISKYCKKIGAILIVDEAHGAHFAFSDKLPETAANYADIWINSAHKTLEVPNQGAYINLGVNSKIITADDISSKLALIHTTSPSYPILAKLDLAWRDKKQDWEMHIQRLETWRNESPLFLQDSLDYTHINNKDFDITRLCFDTGEYDARDIAKQLEKSSIYLEMCDHRRLVAITTPCDDDEWYSRLAQELCKANTKKRDGTNLIYMRDIKPKRIASIREAVFSRSETVDFREAAGRVSAGTIGLYPPGSAIIVPGEIIDEETIKYLSEQRDNGAEIFGEKVMVMVE